MMKWILVVMATALAFGCLAQVAGPGMTQRPASMRYTKCGDVFEYEITAKWYETPGNEQTAHSLSGLGRVEFMKDAGPALAGSPPAIFTTWLRENDDEQYVEVKGYYLCAERNDASGRFVPFGEKPLEGPDYRIVFPSVGFPRSKGQSVSANYGVGDKYQVIQEARPVDVVTPAGTFSTVVVRRSYPYPVITHFGREGYCLSIVDRFVPELGYDASIDIGIAPRRWFQQWKLRSYRLAEQSQGQ